MRFVRHLAVVVAFAGFMAGSSLVSAQSADLPDTAPIATIGAGSTVAVNVDILLPANQGTIYIQNGSITTWEQSICCWAFFVKKRTLVARSCENQA